VSDQLCDVPDLRSEVPSTQAYPKLLS